MGVQVDHAFLKWLEGARGALKMGVRWRGTAPGGRRRRAPSAAVPWCPPPDIPTASGPPRRFPILIGIQWGFVRLLAVLSAGLFLLALSSILRPTERVNFGLFKYASLFMLSAMILLSVGTL